MRPATLDMKALRADVPLCRPGHRAEQAPIIACSPSGKDHVNCHTCGRHIDMNTQWWLGACMQDIRFGYNFTDHMLVVEHIDGHWGAPKIQPLVTTNAALTSCTCFIYWQLDSPWLWVCQGMLQIHPASPVLHYGMGCFEGMKVNSLPTLYRSAIHWNKCAKLCKFSITLKERAIKLTRVLFLRGRHTWDLMVWGACFGLKRMHSACCALSSAWLWRLSMLWCAPMPQLHS